MRYYVNHHLIIPAIQVSRSADIEKRRHEMALQYGLTFPCYTTNVPFPDSIMRRRGVVVVAIKSERGVFSLFTLMENTVEAFDIFEAKLLELMLMGEVYPDDSIPVNSSGRVVRRMLANFTDEGKDDPTMVSHPMVLLRIMDGKKGYWAMDGYEVNGLSRPVFIREGENSTRLGSPIAKSLGRALALRFGEYRYRGVLQKIQSHPCFEVKRRRGLANGATLYERRIAGQTVDYALLLADGTFIRSISLRSLLRSNL